MQRRHNAIDKNEIDMIWERFYKSDKSRSRDGTGTGLGLSIVKKIFELHNANYGVQSEPGKGSMFWFQLVAN